MQGTSALVCCSKAQTRGKRREKGDKGNPKKWFGGNKKVKKGSISIDYPRRTVVCLWNEEICGWLFFSSSASSSSSSVNRRRSFSGESALGSD